MSNKNAVKIILWKRWIKLKYCLHLIMIFKLNLIIFANDFTSMNKKKLENTPSKIHFSLHIKWYFLFWFLKIKLIFMFIIHCNKKTINELILLNCFWDKNVMKWKSITDIMTIIKYYFVYVIFFLLFVKRLLLLLIFNCRIIKKESNFFNNVRDIPRTPEFRLNILDATLCVEIRLTLVSRLKINEK